LSTIGFETQQFAVKKSVLQIPPDNRIHLEVYRELLFDTVRNKGWNLHVFLMTAVMGLELIKSIYG